MADMEKFYDDLIIINLYLYLVLRERCTAIGLTIIIRESSVTFKSWIIMRLQNISSKRGKQKNLVPNLVLAFVRACWLGRWNIWIRLVLSM